MIVPEGRDQLAAAAGVLASAMGVPVAAALADIVSVLEGITSHQAMKDWQKAMGALDSIPRTPAPRRGHSGPQTSPFRHRGR